MRNIALKFVLFITTVLSVFGTIDSKAQTLKRDIIEAREFIVIGTRTIHESAVFQVSATDAGILLPRITTVQRDAIVNPKNSLFIFNTANNRYEFNEGNEAVPNWQPFGGGGADGNGIFDVANNGGLVSTNFQVSLTNNIDFTGSGPVITRLALNNDETTSFTQVRMGSELSQAIWMGSSGSAFSSFNTFYRGKNIIRSLDASLYIVTDEDHEFRIITDQDFLAGNNLTRLHMNGSGEFGINTSPTTGVRWHINGTTRIDNLLHIGDISATGYSFPTSTGTLGQVLEVNASGDLIFATGGGADGDGIYDGGGNVSINTQVLLSTNNISFGTTGDTELIFINGTTDQIGIGKNPTTSGFKLDVNGNIGYNGAIKPNFNAAGNKFIAWDNGVLGIYGLGISGSRLSTEIYCPTNSNAITFGRGDESSFSEFARFVRASGNFMIGTTTDLGAKLGVNGVIRTDVGFNVVGVNGIGGTGGTTFTFGGGSTGNIATMTFRGGILTAVTLVP